MSADPTPFYVLLTCCLCLLCIVVIAIVAVVIVVVMRKRKSDAVESLPPSQPPSPVVIESPVVEDPTLVEQPIMAQKHVPPSAPVEPDAAMTMISSAPLVMPAPEEKAKNPFKPGSVAASSFDVGFDIRDLKMMGFTDEEMTKFKKEEIQSVLDGGISLAELRKSYLS